MDKPMTKQSFFRVRPMAEEPMPMPLWFGGRVRAGFPSPAADYAAEAIDLGALLVPRPSSTFLAVAEGDSMHDEGISDGDLLVIDRSLPNSPNSIALCYLNGEFTLKRIRRVSDELLELVPANEAYPPIPVTPEDRFLVWGILTYSIKQHENHG